VATTEKFRAAKERMRQAKLEAAKIAQEAFKEGATELFDAHHKLDSFGWTQYTPYFNDGDTCTFSANIDEPRINGEDQWDLPALRKTIGLGAARVPNPEFDTELAAAADAVSEFLGGFDSEDFQDMFGDHMQVTVLRDGRLEVAEYEHD
jgi:hypothetical protein